MPEIPNIGFALNLPPDKAIEYFERKGWSISFRWRDTWRGAHSRAFTVAGAMKMDILESIREELQTALKEGRTFASFKKDLIPTLKKLGWWGKTEILDPQTGELRDIDVTPWRLRNIYRTNMQTSYMAGRHAFHESVKDRRPYWQYVAIIDASTRPAHELRNGTVLNADDPWWDDNYPPNGWGCRCRVRSLSQRAVDRRDLTVMDGREFGDVAEEGWDYNPGKEAWKPDTNDYSKEVAEQYLERRRNYEPPEVTGDQ